MGRRPTGSIRSTATPPTSPPSPAPVRRTGAWRSRAYFPSPHRRDLDDILKIAIDVIGEGLRLADNRLGDLHASKYLAPLDPRLDVELEAFDDWSFDDEFDVLPVKSV